MPGAEPPKLKIYLNGERAPGMLCHCCGRVYAGTFFYAPSLGVICSDCWAVHHGVVGKSVVSLARHVAHLFVILDHQFDNEQVRNNVLATLINTAQAGEDKARANLAVAEYNRKIHQKYYSKEKTNDPA